MSGVMMTSLCGDRPRGASVEVDAEDDADQKLDDKVRQHGGSDQRLRESRGRDDRARSDVPKHRGNAERAPVLDGGPPENPPGAYGEQNEDEHGQHAARAVDGSDGLHEYWAENYQQRHDR